ncbi:MAG: CpsB/CapC family capsule biosynthesis tyrosine phosphatase [Thermoanaerobaculia bacterium]|nr:CpsB/CapC family capsule biosynthesis tyrosine phosphatase [Thermoanaerobaculia bacterium]
MIDLHHHCLPGVDDGPDSWEEAIAQCRMAFDEGVHTIVATPHIHRQPWINDNPERLGALVAELNDRLGGVPRILPGSEYFFAHDVVDQLSEAGSIIGLGESRYFLTEFASTVIPTGLDRVLFEIGLAGRVPIIAHPERNQRIWENPGILTDLIDRGARLQITAGSLVGRFGSRSETTAFELLDREMVHFVSTDTHDTDRRPPLAVAATQVLIERYGEERTRALTELNPLAVIEDRELAYEPEPRIPTKPNLWGILKSWIAQ